MKAKEIFLKYLKEFYDKYLKYLIYALIAAVFYIIALNMMCMCENIVNKAYITFNIILALPLFGVLIAVFGSIAASYTVSASFVFLISYINDYVYSSRHTYLQFRDIYCIGDALRVIGSYSPPFSLNIFIKLLFLICSIVIVFYFENMLKKYKPRKAIIVYGGGNNHCDFVNFNCDFFSA